MDACATDLSACFWVKVDRVLGIGVCSECVDKIGEFEKRVYMERGDHVAVNHGIADASVRKRRKTP